MTDRGHDEAEKVYILIDQLQQAVRDMNHDNKERIG